MTPDAERLDLIAEIHSILSQVVATKDSEIAELITTGATVEPMIKLGTLYEDSLPGFSFPNNSQCTNCGFYDTSRLDVLKTVENLRTLKRTQHITIASARCRCGPLVMMQGRIEAGRQGQDG